MSVECDVTHQFESYLVATLPPDSDQLRAADLESYTSADEAAIVIGALTAKRYVVACKDCGLVIGGHAVAQPPEAVATSESSD